MNGVKHDLWVKIDTFPRVRRNTTDLFATLTVLDSQTTTNPVTLAEGASAQLPIVSTQTNLDAALRLQVPKNSGVLLIDGAPRGLHQKRFGILIEPL
jgi:hypothetical protein